MAKVLIVGGGILGTLHALEALGRGFDVSHFEASAEPRAASPRSPGALNFSRAAPGIELDLALLAAERWESLAARIPGLVKRTGSLVVARDAAELGVLESLRARPDATDRGWSVLEPERTRAVNPALGGAMVGSLHSTIDMVVQPRRLLDILRELLSQHPGYAFRGGTEIRDVSSAELEDSTGRVHRGDLVVLCPGSRSELTVSVLGHPTRLQTVRLQIAQTERCDIDLRTPVSEPAALLYSGLAADGSLVGAIDSKHPNESLIGDQEIALTCVQRSNGSLTIGEIRQRQEPFDFDLESRPMELLNTRMTDLIGAPLPPVARHWDGEVRSPTDGRLWIREDLDPTVTLVAGTGQRGITLAPAIASDTFDWLTDGIGSGATEPGATTRPTH